MIGKALTTSTLTTSALLITSSIVSLGASTNQSYTNVSGGSYAGWVSTLSSLTSTTKVSMNQSATTILVTHSNSSTINLTNNTGSTWSSLTGANGLPAGATAYPLTTAAGTPNYTSISQSATGQYVLASVSGGLLYTSANSGATFTAAGMGTPTVYLPMEGVTTDAMGAVTVTATGSPGYVTGAVGSQAINLNNASPGSTASQYLRFPISLTATPNFSVSFWFNTTSLPASNQTSLLDIGTSGTAIIGITIATNGRLDLQWLTSTSSYGSSTILSTVSLNTWYNVTMIYAYNGTCYLYLNGTLANSFAVNFSLYTSMNLLGIGSRITDANYAFKGYIDDFRFYNTAVTFSPIVPMNWLHTAVSATGQYQLATSTMGLFLSVNYGSTWTQVVSVGSWTGLAISSTGQYMTALSQVAGYAPYFSTNYGATWSTSSFNGLAGTFIAISGNGQYSLTGFSTTALLISNYLAGYSTTTYTTPTFSPSIAAAIVTASISLTGQYIVFITQGTTNNVYYSTNYGASFTGITVGSSAMTSCAISVDGSYITVSNATAVYTLNANTAGYSVAIGNSAGLINQGQNAIAIGNQAGAANQSAGSIVLNGTGSALNAPMPGLFASPISNASLSSQPTVNLLGYGSDSQIVNTGASVMSIPNATLDVNGSIAAKGQLYMWDASPVVNGVVRITTSSGVNYIQSGLTTTSDSKADLVFGSIFGGSEWMRIKSTGNVGIGTATPGYLLTVGVAGLPGANSAGTTTLQNYGNINLYRNRLIFSGTATDWNHSIYNNYQNLDNEGAFDGMKFNVYSGAWFRVGTASGTVPTTAMYINSTGSVGIGTTALGSNLQVYNGNASYTTPTVSISDGAADNGGGYGMINLTRPGAVTDNKAHICIIRNGNYLINMGYYQGSNTFGFSTGTSGMSTAGCVMSFPGGNVGIGTTTSSQKLTVNGVIKVDNDSGNGGNIQLVPLVASDNKLPYIEWRRGTSRYAYMGYNSGTTMYLTSENGYALQIGYNSSASIFIGMTGNYVGINNTNPTYNLDVNGTMRVYGAGDNTFTTYYPNGGTWNATLNVGSGTDRGTAQVLTTNGNLHLDAAPGTAMYYGYYSSSRGSANSHQFYGSANFYGTSYFSSSVQIGGSGSAISQTIIGSYSNSVGGSANTPYTLTINGVTASSIITTGIKNSGASNCTVSFTNSTNTVTFYVQNFNGSTSTFTLYYCIYN